MSSDDVQRLAESPRPGFGTTQEEIRCSEENHRMTRMRRLSIDRRQGIGSLGSAMKSGATSTTQTGNEIPMP